MPKPAKEYTNGEITVVWRADICNHSTVCLNLLPSVFDNKEKPWVNMKGATTEEIIKTVSICPSKALSFYQNDNKGAYEARMKSKEVKIKMVNNGPFVVEGAFELEDRFRNKTKCEGITGLCRCGKSTEMPFCDGSHL